MKIKNLHFNTLFIFCAICLSNTFFAQEKTDSLKYPFTDQTGGLYLDNPVKVTATYDPDTDLYLIEQKVAGEDISNPVYMTKEEYSNYMLQQRVTDHYLRKSRDYDDAYRNRKSGLGSVANSIIPGINIKSKAFEQIFGGNQITLTPQGYASIDLGARFQKIDNPQILEQNRGQFDIDLQQRIQMSLLGKIGENLQLKANYDTQAGFGFENRLNLAFRPQLEGSEDNIIQALEVGNVDMPLRSTLMVGPQSLFGVKGEFKFGKTYVTTVFSEQQSQSKTIQTENGGIVQEFEINAAQYEVNANFYMADYFRAKYDGNLSIYPTLSTSSTITRLEVWVKSKNNSNIEDRRSIVAIRDLGGTGETIPVNSTLYTSIAAAGGIRDFDTTAAAVESILPGGNGKTYVVEENMRLLNPSEYTFNAALGTLYLNQPVDEDEVVAISYQIQTGGNYTQVGEFTNDISSANKNTEDTTVENNTATLITKMVKGRGNDPDNNRELWDLMMKNVYSLDAISISPENFRLDVFYNDQQLGLVNYLSNNNSTEANKNERILLAENLDRLIQNGNVQAGGDGFFDFVSGITMDPTNGKMIFTTVEPFNKTLKNYSAPSDQSSVSFPEIYDEIQNASTGESSANNKFFIKGQYTSSSSDDISLGAINVPEGSVVVTANGQELTEGVDYIVDYTLGTVKIINESIKQSGAPVSINLEDQGLFNLTKQRFIGLNLEHRFNENFYIGGTVLNYSERSVTPKTNYGSEPVNNTMFGVNGFYSNEVPFLTRWVDRLPLIETNAPSYITIQGEAAYLKPGQAKNTGNYSYLDDFEGSQSNISIKDPGSWSLASTPQGQTDFNGDANDLTYNDNRALTSWYYIDPIFFSSGGGLTDDQLSNNKSRQVRYREIYPQQDFVEGSPSFISTFDFSFYPDTKGPYNTGAFSSPIDKWGGITRGLNVTNFNEANVEYVEFWLMDPFADGTNGGDSGELILHLGSVSEDILKDGRKQYENGLPTTGIAEDTANPVEPVLWGQVPDSKALLYTFDTEGAARTSQDRGYDGLLSEEEGTIYNGGNNPVTNSPDPAGDDYVYYLDGRWGDVPGATSIVERYKYYRNTEGNSPSDTQELTTPLPDVEDANRDFNLDTQESYFEYRLPISSGSIASDYVVDERTVNAPLENGTTAQAKWYQIRIPINGDESITKIGSPNLNNIRFTRLIAKGFQQPITFRFATFDLVRSNWRRFANKLGETTESSSTSTSINNFEVGVINIEENPDRYVLPPGVSREEFFNTTSIQAQNEQSLLMQVQNLLGGTDDNVRAIYKQSNLDLRRYRRLEMFVHAEDYLSTMVPSDGEVELFIRFGTDVTENYYEYSKPLLVGPSASSGMDPSEVWRDANKIDFNLHDFVSAKIARDGETNPVLDQRFAYDVSETDDDEIYVKGRPTLENVRFITIGVRNTTTASKNIEIWTNELRLSEIDNEGGYAATASINAQLADFANVTASGTIREAGFGAINEGPSERSQEDYKQYAVSTTINADKLLPEKWGIKLPVGLGVSEEFIDPLYSPIDTDVLFSEAANKEELEKVARDYTKRTYVNLLNVRKVKTNSRAKDHFYDVENFSASFGFNKVYHRDFYVENHTTRDLNLGLNYNYSFKQDYKYPFENWKAVNDTASTAKYLLWARDFNVNLKPSRVSFSANIDRRNDEYLYRNVDQYSAYSSGTNTLPFDPIYSNNYFFNWQYQIGFDLTKSLKLDFISSTNNIVDHFNDPSRVGGVNVGIWEDLFDTGRPTKYNQQFRLNYKVPFELLPYLDFVNGDLTYSATYDWRSKSNDYIDTNGNDLGNIIQNSRAFTAQGGLNMDVLYGRSKWYNEYQQRLNSYRSEVSEQGEDYQKRVEKEQKRKSKSKRKQKTKKQKNRLQFKDYLYGLASSLKQVQFNYTSQESTLLPGFLEEPGFFGVGSGSSPSWGFTLGSQADIRARSLRNGWITNSENLVDPYQTQRTNSFGYTMSLELLPDLRLDLTAQKDYSKTNLQYGFNNVNDEGEFLGLNNFTQRLGQFSTTNIGLTSFKDSQAMFDELKVNAARIGGELASERGNDTSGYGLTNQEVMMAALLETYGSSNRSNPIRDIPLPNWTLVYSGLTNNKFLNKKFSRIDLSHAYRSNYTVSGIQSNLAYYEDKGQERNELTGNYNSETIYNDITFVETFAPLIGIDMTFRSNLQLRFMYNRDRIQSFSFSNYSLTDQQTNEFQVGLGYVFKDLKMKMRFRGKKKTLTSDLNLRADLIVADTETSILRVIEDDAQITAGDRQFTLKGTADYNFSKNFNLTFFYNHLITTYKISTAYPITDIRAGVTARFSFGD